MKNSNSTDFGLIVALARSNVLEYNALTNGIKGTIYIDYQNEIGYIWDDTSSIYIKVFDSSSAKGLTFIDGYNAITNIPDIINTTKNIGDFWVVTTSNNNISPPLIGGISSLAVGDWIIWNGSIFIRIESPFGVNAPIELTTDTTISQFNTTYLLNSSSGDINITVPLANSNNSGLYINFIKDSIDSNVANIIPTPQQTFNGDSSYEIYGKNEGFTLRSSGNGTNGWIIESSNRPSEPISGVELEGTINAKSQANDNWLITPSGTLLLIQRYFNGSPITISSFGESIETDRYILKDTSGRLVFINRDNKTKTLIKSSIDGSGSVLGNSEGRVAFINNGEIFNVQFDQLIEDDVINSQTIENQTIDTISTKLITPRVQAIKSIVINLSSVPENTRLRYEILSSNNEVLAQNVSLFDFESESVEGGYCVCDGYNEISLIEELPIQDNYEYTLRMCFSNQVIINGSTIDLQDGFGYRFIPTLTMKYMQGYEYDIAHTANVKQLYENNDNTNVFTDLEKSKLSNIEENAEENVQSDWEQEINTEDDYIKNKPTEKIFATRTTNQPFDYNEEIIEFNNVDFSNGITNSNGIFTFSKSGNYEGKLNLYIDRDDSTDMFLWIEKKPFGGNWQLFGNMIEQSIYKDSNYGFQTTTKISINQNDQIRIKIMTDDEDITLETRTKNVSLGTITQNAASIEIYRV